LGAVGGKGGVFQLLLQPVGLAMPFMRPASLLPRHAPPFALADPRGHAPHDQPGRKGAKQEQKEWGLQREIRLRAAERVEDQLDRLAVDHGKGDEHHGERHHHKAEYELTPQGPLLNESRARQGLSAANFGI
jgi:hypothetical protein